VAPPAPPVRGNSVLGGPDIDPLTPYVPRLVVDWLAEEPEREHRRMPGTLVFADISGFTNLTERLAARGKLGAEQMGELLNAAFDELLTAAYDFGASLIKWGGDAVLLLFDGVDHPARAARAAWNMRGVMRRIGRLQTSVGVIRLGMSIGVHTGEIDFLLVGRHHRELIVTGPAATTTTQMEKLAERGQIVISPATAAILPPSCAGAAHHTGFLLASAPPAEARPNRARKREDVDLGLAVSEHVREHLRGGQVDAEHRWITVGFIEFSGADQLLLDQGTQALLNAVRIVIDAVQQAAHANDVTLLATDLAENGGKIIITAGAPRTAGDDETRVLSTLCRVVQPGGRLSLRAGVTCGSVFAGDYGPSYRKTYSVAGDVVNLAARLMGVAEPGQVLATTAVVERSRTAFDTTGLPAFHVKGKANAVQAVLVGDARRQPEQVRDKRLPLIGREVEIATLVEAAERAAGGQGGVLDIVGMPGIGKSRLIEELAERVQARVFWADGDIYGRATAYQPMQRLLRHALALPVDVEDDIVAATLADLVGSAAPDLLPWLPLIAITAGLELPLTPEIEILDPEIRRDRLEAATSDLLRRLFTMPIVLVLNDIHFMDEATLALIRRLGADSRDRPWLMILTRRPTSVCPVDPAEHVSSMSLEALEESAAGELLVLATDAAPLPGHRLRQLTERAGGNPLFLTRLVTAAASGADLDELPDSLEGVIATQIDRLPARRRRWLRAASVLGMTVDPTLLRAVLAGTDIEDEDWTGLEEFVTMSLDSRLHFAHHLVRLTAYEGLAYRRRTELHARAAEVLEASLPRRRLQRGQGAALLSLHCLRGERYPAAWRYARIAGDQARAQYAPAEAAECYRRALSAATNVAALGDRPIGDVLEALAEVNMDLGEMAEAERALRQARRRARSEPYRLARLQLRTARQRQHLGRHADALRWVSRGRSTLSRAQDAASLRLRAELAERGALIRYDQGAYKAAMVWASRAASEARLAHDDQVEARVEGITAVLAALSGAAWSDANVRESLDGYERAGDRRGKARASNTFGMCAYFAGRWDAAVDLYAEAEQVSHQIGRDFDAAAAAANRAEILVQQGRIAQAEPVLVSAIRVLVAAQATSFLGFALTVYGRATAIRGDHSEAMNRFGEARALCLQMGEIDESLTVEALTAECHLRAGKPDFALSLAEDTLARARQVADGASAQPLLHRVRGEALIATGLTAQGQLALRDSLAISRQRQARNEIEAALTALIRCGAARTAEEMSLWSEERNRLVEQLGIVLQTAERPGRDGDASVNAALPSRNG
jgi:class 3 adenylate cyclase/tetratricopeptide (TPR) repeat protein